MSKSSIPRPLRRRVLAESLNQCAYSHTLTTVTGARPVIDHIIPEAVGGVAELENLCLACHSCNEFKAARIQAPDPKGGDKPPLFHPRQQRWSDHFCWSADGTEIIGLTAIGRATAVALNMNHPLIVEARRRWVAVGWHPPPEDL